MTVLMTVYNGCPYLRTAIDSVLTQTYRAFRFLIVDDCSTDGTRDLVRSYEDSRIELVGLERNVGQTAALNIGLHRAASPWIARMDADDYAVPTRLEEQMRELETHPSLGCVGTFAWLFRDDPRVVDAVLEKPLQHEAIWRQLWRGTPMIHASLIIRRSALLDIGGYDERYRFSADIELYNRLLPRCRAANLPRLLMGLRRHPNQGSYGQGTFDENIEIFSRILTTQCRTRRDRATVRRSLSFTYVSRAKLLWRTGRVGWAVSDLREALRWSPSTVLKQVVSPMIPARVRSRIRRHCAERTC